jgi:Smg protein
VSLSPINRLGVLLRERVLAIVSLIAQYFLEDRDIMTENDLVEELLAVGFEAEEIDAAFNWMENQTLAMPASQTLTAPSTSYRVFTAEENRLLDAEARGFLTRLRSLGLVDDETHEDIIHRAIQTSEGDVTLKDIKTVTVLTLFSQSQNEWMREFDCLLEDDWPRLLN